MQTKMIVTALVTAVVFGVAGWFVASKTAKVKPPPHEHINPNKCSSGDCNVTIKFACITPASPTADTCDIYADPEVVLIKPGKQIKFTIDNTYGFPFDQTDGIKFTSSNSGSFVCTPNGNQKYKCDNTLAADAPIEAYKYQIHVTGFDIADPWVVNY